MRTALWAILILIGLFFGDRAAVGATDESLERILRAQAFNKEFEGFDSYYVNIVADQPQADGSHEVVAVAGGKFSDQTKRMTVLFLIVGDHIIGGQVLEGVGLPPCLAPDHHPSSSL